jgi:cob(I)alamin adenosyltransferase
MKRFENEDDHKRVMEKLQKVMEKKIARADREKGLLMVHTGNGKGKSSAALGMLIRCLGHGYRCAVVQFIKGEQATAETALQQAFPSLLRWDRVGEGFTWDTQDRAADIATCRAGWEIVRGHLADPTLKFLLLDELNIVLSYDYLPLEDVMSDLTTKREDLHVVVTGRGAPQPLMDAADLVTEMKEIKHPFKAGIKAQPGIEF